MKVHGLLAGLLLAVALPAWSADPAPLAAEDVRVRAVAHFDFDRDTLAPQDQARLLADVAKLENVSWQEVVVVGHTDSVGPPDYNEALSERRAGAVKRYLVDKGLAPAMIQTEGRGAGQPEASNTTADGRGRNRRAEVEFRGVRTVAAR